jgi:hypothetical protein
MTIAQSSTWVGVAANDVRPGVRARIGQQMLRVAKDQAAVYEETTGIKVPGSGTIAATPHVHDGVNGAIIPIPLFHIFIGGVFGPSPLAVALAARSNGGWSPIAKPIQWVPTGVTAVRIWISADIPAFSRLRVETFDSTLAQYDVQTFTPVDPISTPLVGGIPFAYADVGVSGGEINIFSIQYRTAQPDAAPHPWQDQVFSVTGYPFAGEGKAIDPHIVQGSNSLDVLVPSSTQYAPLSTGYHPTQEENYADDDAISGFMCHAGAYNDGQLFELITGQPYPGKASKVWAGHNHGAAASVTTSSSKGADMDQPLLAVNYGVRRQKSSAGDHRFDDDAKEGTRLPMEGRIWCSQLTTATGTSYQTLGSYPFEMPAALAANVQGGSSRLRFAALVHVHIGRITSGKVRASISNSTYGATGTALELTAAGDGLQIVSGAIDYHGAADVAYAGEMAHLNIDAKRDTNYVASTLPTMGVLSACLYYEDA